jgi:RNA polymerase sigma factor (sigma-70 family)
MTEGIAARNCIVIDCTPIVKRIVARIRPPDHCYDDCIQAGHMAVMKAVDKWNPETTPYEALVACWIKPSVVREVYREIERTKPQDDVPVHELAEYEDSNDTVTDEALLVEDIADDLLHRRDSMIDAIIGMRDKVTRNLMLHVLEGHSVSESGRLLGLTQSSADRLYQRAVTTLREKLSAG